MDQPHTVSRYRRFLSADPRERNFFGEPFRPLEPECKVVQFHQPLAPGDLERAAALFTDRPDVELYVYGRAAANLDFLQHFAAVRRFHLSLYDLEDCAGLSHVQPGLEKLTFGRTKKTFSLRFLASFPQLTELFLVGHKKDLASIQSLGHLTKLGLSGITLPDLSLLLPLKALQDLSIFLGSTTNLALLAELPNLQSLFLMRITKLSDLAVLAHLHSLRSLRLDWLRNVTSLPSFRTLHHLEEVTLDTMKGLADLTPVADALALRRLTITQMPQLTAASFRCLLNHPALQQLWAFTGKSKVNAEVQRMFPEICRPFPAATA